MRLRIIKSSSEPIPPASTINNYIPAAQERVEIPESACQIADYARSVRANRARNDPHAAPYSVAREIAKVISDAGYTLQ